MTSAVILAGGRSSRMGSNKALLKLHTRSLIEELIAELRKEFQPVIVVSNAPDLYKDMGVTVVEDDYPGYGPLAGIHAGLKAAPSQVIFTIPCDMPFVGSDLGLQMLAQLGDADGLVLEVNGQLEPLCALYTKSCLPVIEEFLQAKRLKVIDFYPRVRMKILPVEKLRLRRPAQEILFNINTPADFAAAKAIVIQDQGKG